MPPTRKFIIGFTLLAFIIVGLIFLFILWLLQILSPFSSPVELNEAAPLPMPNEEPDIIEPGSPPSVTDPIPTPPPPLVPDIPGITEPPTKPLVPEVPGITTPPAGPVRPTPTSPVAPPPNAPVGTSENF